MARAKPILLLEDDIVDASTIIQTVEDLKVKNELIHKTDGEQGLEYLKDPSHRKPGLILLDLNMPKINGIEFLQAIKSDRELRKIPVVVLTVSKYEKDKFDTFGLGVAGYVVKPVDYDNFLESMNTVIQYWMCNDLVDQERQERKVENAKL